MTVTVNIEEGTVYGDTNFNVPVHMNFGKLFLDQILKYGNGLAVIDGDTDEQITYAEIAQKIVNVASSLKRLGISAGEVVAICSENRIELLITAVAVLYSGSVLTFFTSAYSQREIIHLANISKPKYVFMSKHSYKIHYNTLEKLNIIKQYFMFGEKEGLSNVTYFEDLAQKSVTQNYEGANFNGQIETGLILYSSGTTGLPKGVRLTHLNYITTAYQVPVTYRKLAMLTVAIFTHTLGFQNVVIGLYHGKTIVFLSKFDEDLYLRCIDKYKVGFALLAPATLMTLTKSPNLHKYDLSSLEFFHCGGAKLELQSIEQAKARFPKLRYVFQGYGMTESAVISRETEETSRTGSVGRVVRGCTVKIVDIQTRKPLKPKEQGEICIKGPAVFDGYVGVNMDEYMDNGFLKTGDIGYYDEDGYLYVVDRLKELIKYNSWQVPPSELESILLKLPDVLDAAVVGKPDEIAGELPTAFVVKKPGSDIREDEIMGFLNSKVSPWKRLRGGVRFVEEIPKNPSGKILRRLLRDALIKPPSKL